MAEKEREAERAKKQREAEQHAAEEKAEQAKRDAEEQAAGETGTAAGHVLSSAKLLSDESNKLKTAVEGFMEKVRAEQKTAHQVTKLRPFA